ncbi:MAG: hypothetical protein QG604_362 [Candidatus Dependentiae bacterium]|nr:hypothetical protein [Candidatus Dependentiae bacterium]
MKTTIFACIILTLVGQQVYGTPTTMTAVTTTPRKKGSLGLDEVSYFSTAKIIYGLLCLTGSGVALKKISAKIADTQEKIGALRTAKTNAGNKTINTGWIENDADRLTQLEAALGKYTKLKWLSFIGAALGTGMLAYGLLNEQELSDAYHAVKAENEAAVEKDRKIMEIVEIVQKKQYDRHALIACFIHSNDKGRVTSMAHIIADARRSPIVRMLAPLKATPTTEDEEKARTVLDYYQALRGEIKKKEE